jgi:hypothetical protein
VIGRECPDLAKIAASIGHELGLTPSSVYYVAEGRIDVAGWVRREVNRRFNRLAFDPSDAVDERAGT